ncbi:hypothetical protein ACFL25_01265 [Patescibacteria group bacterium]
MFSGERIMRSPQGLLDNPEIMKKYESLRVKVYESECVAKIINRIRTAGPIMVVDPEKAYYDLEDTLERVRIFSRMGGRILEFGGSTDNNNEAEKVIPFVREVIDEIRDEDKGDTLIISFPGTSSQVVEGVDAVFSLFPPQLDEVFRQDEAMAQYWTAQYFGIIENGEELGVPVIPVTYILFNGGRPTTVEKQTGIRAIDVKDGVNVNGVMRTIKPWLSPGDLGMIELGSSPETSVDLSGVAEEVFEITKVPWIVTGGVNSVEHIRRVTRNRPFPVVFGSVAEKTPPDYFGMLCGEFIESHPLTQARYVDARKLFRQVYSSYR